MTEEQKENKVRKLTLGGSKLSLGNYPKKVVKTLGSSGSVVVEVKRGKASGEGISLDHDNNKHDLEQDSRRLEALQKFKTGNIKENNVHFGSLSQLAEINQNQVADNNDPKHLNNSTVDTKEQEEKAQVELPKQPKIEGSKATAGDIKAKEQEPKKDKTESTETGFSAKKEYNKKLPLTKDKDDKTIEEKSVLAKQKVFEQKKLKKSDIIYMLDEDSGKAPVKTRSLASIKRARAKEKRKNRGDVKAEKLYREVTLPETITVAELASSMSERTSDVTRELMKIGVMATSTQSIDADTAELVATILGHSVKRVKESDIEDVLINIEDNPVDLRPRAPVVTVMGHVDHGKTSLLDALRSTDIVSDEAGGITQHIGAYTITIADQKMITFIDTPGHEAFTQMRIRGAKVTDIVVLVVAADDGIKAQTVEAINHAKAAKVPIIVAINKIDKPEADVERVKTELLNHKLVPEELGGDIITVGVSAKQKKNLDKLEEVILLVAEMQELTANPNAMAKGVVIESRVDKNRGVVATMIVQRGTLKTGDIIIARDSYGRVRRLCNNNGRTISEAGPSVAVEVYGLDNAPSAGDMFNVVQNDKQARDIVSYRQRKARNSQVTASNTSLEELFLKASGKSKMKELPIIIKGDVHGSIEAIINSLEKIDSDEVKVKILHSAVGAISESDVTFASASGALVIGFNVRANNAAAQSAGNYKVDIRYYSIIYNLIDDIKSIMSGMLSPIIREEYIGSVSIREVFNISKVGKIAGSYVTKGIIKKGANVRLLRDNIVIHQGRLKTLKRFKEDMKEVKEGFECGVALENYNDIKVDDIIEVFEVVEEQKKL